MYFHQFTTLYGNDNKVSGLWRKWFQSQGNYNGELTRQQLRLVWKEKQVNNNEGSMDLGCVRLLALIRCWQKGNLSCISLPYDLQYIYIPTKGLQDPFKLGNLISKVLLSGFKLLVEISTTWVWLVPDQHLSLVFGWIMNSLGWMKINWWSWCELHRNFETTPRWCWY